jgi:hypothetical protein
MIERIASGACVTRLQKGFVENSTPQLIREEGSQADLDQDILLDPPECTSTAHLCSAPRCAQPIRRVADALLQPSRYVYG